LATKGKYLIVIVLVVALAAAGTIFLLSNAGDNPLKGTSWTRTTDVDSETLNFNKDGHFAYYYGNGSPVDDYDLYDQYTYDTKTKIITLKGDDFGGRTMTVVSLDQNKIVLIIDGEERSFDKYN
jgi:hypothetical protein